MRKLAWVIAAMAAMACVSPRAEASTSHHYVPPHHHYVPPHHYLPPHHHYVPPHHYVPHHSYHRAYHPPKPKPGIRADGRYVLPGGMESVCTGGKPPPCQ